MRAMALKLVMHKMGKVWCDIRVYAITSPAMVIYTICLSVRDTRKYVKFWLIDWNYTMCIHCESEAITLKWSQLDAATQTWLIPTKIWKQRENYAIDAILQYHTFALPLPSLQFLYFSVFPHYHIISHQANKPQFCDNIPIPYSGTILNGWQL